MSDDVEVWDAANYAAEGGPWLCPYEAFATGAGKDENGRYMALVLTHAADASAEENVGLLRRIIEEEGSVLYGRPMVRLHRRWEIGNPRRGTCAAGQAQRRVRQQLA